MYAFALYADDLGAIRELSEILSKALSSSASTGASISLAMWRLL
tara:strand:+ start:78188 stop:78319 length:132 start_codon:yes stop_codon:yes gene_type:complete